LGEPAFGRQAVNKGLGRSLNSAGDAIVKTHEMARLIPCLPIRAGQVEAASLVLFDRRDLRQTHMKFAVMAEYHPAFVRNLCNPFVVSRVVREFELVFWIVLKFDRKWRSRRPDSFGKALSKISIKIED
jgi:hypothetical protein